MRDFSDDHALASGATGRLVKKIWNGLCERLRRFLSPRTPILYKSRLYHVVGDFYVAGLCSLTHFSSQRVEEVGLHVGKEPFTEVYLLG